MGLRVRALLAVILLSWAPKRSWVSNYLCGSLFMLTLIGFLETLKAHWQSSIYTFFKPEVEFQYFENWPCHFFTCLTPKCKTHIGSVHHSQDSKDKLSTANLKHHALHCFGADTINAAIGSKKPIECNKSIFALSAHKGKQPVKYLHRNGLALTARSLQSPLTMQHPMTLRQQNLMHLTTHLTKKTFTVCLGFYVSMD